VDLGDCDLGDLGEGDLCNRSPGEGDLQVADPDGEVTVACGGDIGGSSAGKGGGKAACSVTTDSSSFLCKKIKSDNIILE
jgi:hypothetical protein